MTGAQYAAAVLDEVVQRELCALLDDLFFAVVSKRGVREQPDSRAFGAHVEQTIKDEWSSLCADWHAVPKTFPGRRTIYDAAFTFREEIVGVDFKSKDLASDRFSDGGVCSIGNLIRFYLGGGNFFITEFGYEVREGMAEFKYVRTAPFHTMPESLYRIENLGTGQVRLNEGLSDCWDRIAWDRPLSDFLVMFCKLAAAHYERVATVALKRSMTLTEFVDSDFTKLGKL